MQIQTVGDTTEETIGTYTFKSKKYWEAAQHKWMDIMQAAYNEERNNRNVNQW